MMTNKRPNITRNPLHNSNSPTIWLTRQNSQNSAPPGKAKKAAQELRLRRDSSIATPSLCQAALMPNVWQKKKEKKKKATQTLARKFTPPKNMVHIIISEVRFISLVINLLRMFTTTTKTE